MDRALFAERLGIAARRAVVFARELVEETLPDTVRDLAKWDEVFLGPYLTELGLDDAYSFDTQEVGGKTLARFRYGSTLTVQIVEGLSHQYANGTNHPLVYAEQMWKFFQQHPLP